MFSKEEINTGRQMSVDIAKMFSIFFMVAIHTLEEGEADLSQGIGYFIDSIVGAQFGAPVFMTCMGIGMTYSRRNDAATMAKRGWKLIAAGYLLNLARMLPFILVWFNTRDAEYGQWVVQELFDVDILQFAGVAFLLLALLKKLGVNMWWTALLALLMSISGGILRGVDTGNFALNLILSPFIGIYSEIVKSDFPLLNWFLFVVLGYGIGKLIRRCNNLNKLFLWTLPIATVLYLGYIQYAIPNSVKMFGEDELFFYHMDTCDLLVCMTAVLISISLSHFCAKPLSEPVRQEVIRICSDLTKIYIAQWIIIKWFVRGLMVDYFGLSLTTWQLLGVSGIILVLSILWARVKPLSQLKI